MEILKEVVSQTFTGNDFLVESLKYLIIYLITSIPTTLGAIFAQYHHISSSKDETIKFTWREVFTSSVIASLIMSSIVYYDISWLNIGLRFLLAFVLGMLGNEIFAKFVTIDGIMKFFNDIMAARRGVYEVRNVEMDVKLKEKQVEDEGKNGNE